MQVELDDFIAKAQAFLVNNDVVVFANEWLVPYLHGLSAFAPPTMILAPTDMALHQVEIETGKDWSEIQESEIGLDILYNHVSATPTQKVWPMITSVNGRQYGHNQQDIEILQPGASKVIRLPNAPNFKISAPVVIIVISKVLIYEDQLAKLRASALRGNEIPKLGKDVFRKLVIEQKLRGKSLLALCTSDRDIASLCDRDDQVLFKTLLKEEFNFDYNKHYAKGSPRELYAKLHKFRVEIYITVTGVQDNEAEIKSAYKLIRDDEIGPEAINRYLKDYRQRVVVPLEGWFAENFNRRPARPFDMALLPGSNEQVQSPVYLVYVSNMPETASLVRRKATVYDSNEYTSGAYETSNSWFSNYFSQNNRLPLHNEEIFRNPIRSVEALIKLMLSRNPIRLAIDVTTENGENLTIACILLSGGGLR